MEHTAAGLACIDGAGLITYANPACAALFGCEAHTLPGRAIADFLGDEADAATAATTLPTPPVVRRVRRADGEMVPVTLAISAVGESQAVATFLPLAKEAEPAAGKPSLRQLTVNLAAMTRLHALSMLLARPGDFESLLSRILEAATDLTGTDKGSIQFVDAITGALMLVVHRGVGARFVEHFAQENCPPACCAALRVNERCVVEDVAAEPELRGSPLLAILLGDGIRAMASVPLVTRGGEPLGLLNVHFRAARRPSEEELRVLELLARMAADFVERSHTDLELRQSEERFRALVTASAQFFFRMSPDWIEMRLLDGGEFLGVELQATATWLQDHVHPGDHLLVLQAIEAARRAGGNYELQHRIVRRDRTVRWVLTRAVPLRNPAGGIVEWFGSCTDITEKRFAEEELRRHQGLLEERVQERTAELDAANGALRDEILERGRSQRQHREVLRLLSSAQEDERRRISRELHDEVGQLLASLMLGLNDVADRFSVPRDAEAFRTVYATAQAIASEIHNLAVELRPTSLDDLGLERALAAYVDLWSARAKVPAEFHSEGFDGERLDPTVETTVYRIVQEALHNVMKHAQARQVSIIVTRSKGWISTIVEDDGRGFDPDEERPRHRLGLLGVQERVSLVGGDVSIESGAGKGTTLLVRIPLA